MTFWDACYHGPNCFLHGAAGYYATFGDGETAHTPTSAVPVSLFTDYCISLATHLLANPEESFSCYHVRCEVPETVIRFLATVRHLNDKRQWFSMSGLKVSSSESKQHDKRWTEVPTWADGSVAGALHLYYLTADRAPREWLPKYAAETLFWDTLYSVAPEGNDWFKIQEAREKIPGDHRAAYVALKQACDGITAFGNARRSLSCAVHNSTLEQAA